MENEIENLESETQIEKPYTNIGVQPIINIGNTLFMKFDVNDGENLHYCMMHETDDGILIDLMLDIVVFWDCKSHAVLNYGERFDGAWWGYKNDNRLRVVSFDITTFVNTPVMHDGMVLTDNTRDVFIEDETLQCVVCGADKSVNMKLGEPAYICPHWHF